MGLVSATGTDVEGFAANLKDQLKALSYRFEAIRLIDLLREFTKWKNLPESPLDERIEKQMDAGTSFRETLNHPEAVALLGLGKIMKIRKTLAGAVDKPVSRCAYLLRSLKNPSEVELLRDIYGPAFVLIGAYAPHDLRVGHLSRLIAESKKDFQSDSYHGRAEELIHRDQQEPGTRLGQNVRDTFHRADVFVDASEPGKLKKELQRFINLLFGCVIDTPTRDEYGMFHAQAAAMRSADLGRQVGAAIATGDGDIVAVGTNEVPKAGGGLYWRDDLPDQRDFVLGYDSNDRSKRNLLADLLEGLRKGEWFSEEKGRLTSDELLKLAIGTPTSILRKAQFMNLIEFGRAVHAEMAALMDAARTGVSVMGATLYCTTFPCHLCAKHIVAAGIRRVVYIEPYPKSLATQLYPDSISVECSDKDAREVRFEPFVGIAPRQYMNLFSMKERKNENGYVIVPNPVKATPRCQNSPQAYLFNEKNALIWLEKATKANGLSIETKGGE